MPRYTQQQRSSFTIDGPNVVAWVILVFGLLGSIGFVVAVGWSGLPVAAGALGSSLITWAGLRVLLQVRNEVRALRSDTENTEA